MTGSQNPGLEGCRKAGWWVVGGRLCPGCQGAGKLVGMMGYAWMQLQEVPPRPKCWGGLEGRPGVREAGEDAVTSRKTDQAATGGRGGGPGGVGEGRGTPGSRDMQESQWGWPFVSCGVMKRVPRCHAWAAGWMAGCPDLALWVQAYHWLRAQGRPALPAVRPESALTGVGGRLGPTPLCSVSGSELPASFPVCVADRIHVQLDLGPLAEAGSLEKNTFD